MDTPVTGAPRHLLRLEGLAAVVAAVIGYRALGGSWTTFLWLVLVPDLALLGYLAGPRAGAMAYNAVHTYAAPAALGLVALAGSSPGLWPVCLVWVAHIGVDRALGLGLKFPTDFGLTHLGPIGRRGTSG